MIAYNNEWLNNLLVRNQSDEARKKNCISKTAQEQIHAVYPVGFYTPNIFIRIGLFILTMIIVQFAFGLVSLVLLSAMQEEHFGGLFIFYGLLVYAGLEFMVKKNHYKSGVDDALMWMAAGSLIGGLNAVARVSPQTNAIVIFIVALFLFLRFTALLMAVVASLALPAIIFFSVIRFGDIGKAITPFILMIAAAFIYFFARRLLQYERWKQYTKGLLAISIVALVCFYVSGNYFVVREASVAMFNLDLKEGESIPFGWLFWVFTVAIPILYMVRGIQKKDAVLLRVGLLLVAAIVFTVRYYYHVIAAETAMVMGGILLIAVAYALIKYLHEPKYGFTSEEQDNAFLMDKLQIESLVIAQTFTGPQLPADTGTQFGGGTGGGGGASGEF